MKLAEIAFFTDKVASMTDFYRRFLGVEPVAHSETMAIFFANNTKIFIHHKYAPKDGELPPEDPMRLRCRMWIRPVNSYYSKDCCSRSRRRIFTGVAPHTYEIRTGIK